MYKMKIILSAIALLSLLAAASPQALAQEYTYTLANTTDNSIEFTFSRGDLVIEGHDSDQVVIRNLDYEPVPDRAKGLKALYNSAEDNTGIGLSVEEDNGVLKIITASGREGDYRLLVPNRVRLMIEEVNWGGSDFELRNLRGEIEIKSKTADIKMMNITGPVIANSTSGDVEIAMDALSQMGPTSISLVSGFIDIAMPASAEANLQLSSISGEIYTDLDVELKGVQDGPLRRLGVGVGRKVQGTLNGGGVEVNLKTISGDIYLRRRSGN